jgi:ribosomal protein L37AE/L43A
MEYFWKCAVSFIAGGIFGFFMAAIMTIAKRADEHLERKEDAAPAECFWCDGRMAKMPDGVLVCSECGWRYKGKESEVEEGSD